MKRQNIFWGIILITMALFIIANQMGFLAESIGIWSIIWGIFFGAVLVNGIVSKSFGEIFFSLAFLWVIFDEPFGLPEMSIWAALIVAVLLSVGFNCLFPGFDNKKIKTGAEVSKKAATEGEWRDYEDPDKVGKYQQVQAGEGEYMYYMNRFGSTAKYINTDNFKAIRLDCSFGEMKVYFDCASIVEQSAKIEVYQYFGSMQLYLPKGWKLVQNVSVIIGSVSERNHSDSSDGPMVYLEGEVRIGEIQIIYV